MKVVVVVESPTKAKTISSYLGEGYQVVASYGHVRDLSVKDGSVRPDENFAMDWEVGAKAERHIKDIARAVRGANRLYLATDPDREGEAISWHVYEELTRRAVLDGVDVKRITFHEITREAVQNSLCQARNLNDELIEAYLARRALDYLVGFTLSPVLWHKLPGSRSAGRVQSVALRLVCEREAEIECFVMREYWTVDTDLLTTTGAKFTARLTHLDGNKLDKFTLVNKESALTAKARIETSTFIVDAVERKKVKRYPSPPFTTSTLQQEAARKLHFAARHTMQIAQRLYEGVNIAGENTGLVTYMRTDGVQIAACAVETIRDVVVHTLGTTYRPAVSRVYKSRAKNAQEAHEAIRPTDINRHPQMLAAFLDHNQLQLYELIWKRTVASQMESAELEQIVIDVISTDKTLVLRAVGSVVTFDGFLHLYRENHDEDSLEDSTNKHISTEQTLDSNCILPLVAKKEILHHLAVRPKLHFTQPPPRYSEASLIKKLEELGIGRPSTYAAILAVLQDRNYVRIESRSFIPEDLGRVVTAFLENYFNRYIQYTFTAELEEKLDDVSGGRINWKTVLRQFWDDFIYQVNNIRGLRISEVLDRLDSELGQHFFPDDDTGCNQRQCPTCMSGRLSLKLGRFGAFIGCSNYPSCCYTRPLSILVEKSRERQKNVNSTRMLGSHPRTGAAVSLHNGPYGFYIQLDHVDKMDSLDASRSDNDFKREEKRKSRRRENIKEKSQASKPKRVSLPKSVNPAVVTLETAILLLDLPREIGLHPDSGHPVIAGLGRFGPYLRYGDVYKSLPIDEDILTIGINRAITILAAVRQPAQSLGAHPADGKPVLLKTSRFRSYVEHGNVRATLIDVTKITLDTAVTLLAAQAKSEDKGHTCTVVGVKKQTRQRKQRHRNNNERHESHSD